MENIQELRLEALKLAVGNKKPDTPMETVLLDAEKYLDYISNGKTKPAQAQPISELVSKTIMRVNEDVQTFCNYVLVDHPLKPSVPYRPYDFQRECFDAFNDHRFVLVNQARQMGVTTTAMVYALWKAITIPDSAIVVCAASYANAMDMMDRIRFIYEHLPVELKPSPREYSKGSMRFDNGSIIMGRAISSNACRGLNTDLLVIDNTAFISHAIAKDFYLSVRPTLAEGRAIVISSPGQRQGLFHDLWVGNNDFYKISLPWHRHPDRGPDFETTTRAQIGDDAFENQFNCQFSKPRS